MRYVGFTGHKDPRLHLEMLAHDYAWDACQLPLNCFDASFRSFEREVLPELQRRGIAAIGMKSLCGDARAVTARIVSARDARLCAQPAGRDGRERDGQPEVLAQNLAVARGFRPLSARRLVRSEGGSRRMPPTDASSCTRSPRRSKAPRPARARAAAAVGFAGEGVPYARAKRARPYRGAKRRGPTASEASRPYATATASAPLPRVRREHAAPTASEASRPYARAQRARLALAG